MDFEERLARAERSDSPSLVGASMRSADDSPHKNYIHPEKYVSSRAESRSKSRTRSSKLKSSVTASLDDLINEGALLGSEEDFDKFLDDDGTVKHEAKYTNKLDEEGIEEEDEGKESVEPEEIQQKIEKAIEQEEPLRGRKAKVVEEKNLEKEPTEKESKPTGSKNAALSFYKQDDYSTPNLSDYQLDQNITDHNDFVNHVQSYDLEKLPRSNSSLGDEEKTAALSRPRPHTTLSSAQQQRLESSLHPFHTDRPRSRSRSSNPSSRIAARSSSSSSSSRHLARGDSYKNVHSDEPSKYELPADFSTDEVKESHEAEEEDRGRAARPTMGDSIAAAEARKSRAENDPFVPEYASNPISREPSLVTTGDYTNFEVDNPRTPAKHKPNTRFIRSSSSHPMDEKNDSNVDGLKEEGALVTDDPYASIDQLDSLMEEVLQGFSKHSETKVEDEKTGSEKDKKTGSEKDEKTGSEKDEKTDSEKDVATKAEEPLTKKTAASANSSEEFRKKEDVNTVEDDLASVDKEDKEDKEPSLDETLKEGVEKKETNSDPSESAATEKEETSDSKEVAAKGTNETTNEDVIQKDAKRAEVEGNEKDDADTTGLKEEGVLTSEDPLERVEESELREGVSISDLGTKKSEATEESKGHDRAKLEASNAKLEDNLIQGSLNTDGPADLEKIEKEEKEGLKENEDEKKKEAEGKIPKDEEAELDSAKKNEPNLIVGGNEESERVEQKESNESVAKKSVDDKAPFKEASTAQEATEDLSSKGQQDDELQAGKKDTDSEHKADAVQSDSSGKLLEGTLNANGPEELKGDVKGSKSIEETKTTADTEAKKEESSKIVEPVETEPKKGNTTKEAEQEVELSEETPEPSVADTASSDDISKKAESKEENTESAEEKKAIESIDDGSKSTVDSAAATAHEVTSLPSSKKDDPPIDEFDDLEDISPEEIRKHLESQPIYIFTSLAGGAQIIPRTNRLATILQANGIKFEYRDLGTDEEAKKIWRRQASGKTLPGVVRGDDYVGNWQEIDEANEEYQVKDLLYSF
ncbi:unnamed protein product [Candida parapsilosis]|uniref:Glutaredoxin domain-containing protein n=1 Tax=Candida parapsilosis (strain CDC 317 / ATCC MYA-4646) TaxID=578454 RepID=G8B5I9_CANPC|nr:uncharacterized protein CPAR2_603000 [Candida parapsilosis]CCE39881.1 hypothetical protein CPAR2_603000 [Candida parapsilosis]